ncbi:MAG TPA: phosphoribosylglycinamide formyltransferase [Polyangia bacterium]|nr:phosphoribosylglycinamide formyltransferase [Polyangia bacterium]
MKVGVLASGGGTNLQSLIDVAARGELGPARLAAVGVNVPDCGALHRARAAGIPTFVVDHRQFAERALFDQALLGALRLHEVELVVLAGFMRLLGADFLSAFAGRVINVHPALLPAFPGTRAQEQAFAYGVKVAGCTVHFVDAGVDSGPVIAQTALAVRDDDSAETLRLRILAEEHKLLPAVVRALAEGRVFVQGRRVRVSGAQPGAGVVASL